MFVAARTKENRALSLTTAPNYLSPLSSLLVCPRLVVKFELNSEVAASVTDPASRIVNKGIEEGFFVGNVVCRSGAMFADSVEWSATIKVCAQMEEA